MKPAKLRVMHLTYKVVWSEDITQAGLCDTARQRIVIDPRLSNEAKADTFLHEVIHAINDTLRVRDGTSEEDATHRISAGLCCVWEQNPKVMDWWRDLLL